MRKQCPLFFFAHHVSPTDVSLDAATSCVTFADRWCVIFVSRVLLLGRCLNDLLLGRHLNDNLRIDLLLIFCGLVLSTKKIANAHGARPDFRCEKIHGHGLVDPQTQQELINNNNQPDYTKEDLKRESLRTQIGSTERCRRWWFCKKTSIRTALLKVP